MRISDWSSDVCSSDLLCHEGSFHAFDKLARSGRKVRRPDLTFAIADHYVPTRDRAAGALDPEIATMIRLLGENAAANDVRLFGLDDPDQGIVHVVAPELRPTPPGHPLVWGDSHTPPHAASGAAA